MGNLCYVVSEPLCCGCGHDLISGSGQQPQCANLPRKACIKRIGASGSSHSEPDGAPIKQGGQGVSRFCSQKKHDGALGKGRKVCPNSRTDRDSLVPIDAVMEVVIARLNGMADYDVFVLND